MSNNINDNNPPPSVSFHFAPPSGPSDKDNDSATSKENISPIVAKVFEDHSMTGGSLLSTSEMGRSALAERPSVPSVQPKTLEEECEKLRQQIRENYLGNQVLHALIGYRAGSGISISINNFINKLKINELKLLSKDIRSLIKRKEKVKIPPGEVFYRAIAEGKNLLVQFLCAVGSDCLAFSQGLTMQIGDSFPLKMAVQEQNLELVEALLEAGAPVDMQDCFFSDTALHISRNPAIISALINAGASVNIQDREGSTALMYAIYDGNVEKVKLCLQAKKIDLGIQNKQGKTAFTIGSWNHEILPLLLAFVKSKECEKLRQQIREDYLGNQVLHALIGYRAGSGISTSVNKFY